MKNTHLLTLIAVLFLQGCASKSDSEMAVENMLDGLQWAVEAQNLEGVLTHFTDQAEVVFDYPPILGGSMDIDIDEYGKMLELAWKMPADYTYEVSDISIVMSADGTQATVTDRVNETISMQGQLMMSTETLETLDIEIINGIAKITRLHGVAEIDM